MTGIALETTHIKVLRDSTISTFGAFCGSEPSYDGSDHIPDEAASVQGIIAMVGDLSWSVTLGFPPETATALALKFAGFEIPFESEDMTDVVGELANVLAGDLVARLDALGVSAKMSLPSVARGRSFSMVQPGASSAAQLRFTLPQGPMWIGLAVGKVAA